MLDAIRSSALACADARRQRRVPAGPARNDGRGLAALRMASILAVYRLPMEPSGQRLDFLARGGLPWTDAFLLPLMLSPVAVSWMVGKSMMEIRFGPLSTFAKFLGWSTSVPRLSATW